MAFFDRLRLSLSSPLRQQPDNQPIKTWNVEIPANFGEDSIRLLLYRECDRRGRKVLYDSANVVRDKYGKFSYLPPLSTSEFRDLSEWIFGCVPLSSNSTKRFHRFNGNFMWSQVFLPKRRMRNPSISSIGSSLSYNSTYELNSNSSGYLSGIDDLSYENRLTNSSIDSTSSFVSNQSNTGNSLTIKMINSNNWSLPNMIKEPSQYHPKTNTQQDSSSSSSNQQHSTDIKTSHSLPSKLENSTSSSGCGVSSSGKTFLALAILISPPPGLTDSQQHIFNTFGSYLTANSSAIEAGMDWFASVSAAAYSTPSHFVQKIYLFAISFRGYIFQRFVSPLINIASLSPAWKILHTSNQSANISSLNLITEFLSTLLSIDLGWTNKRIYNNHRRARIVVIASQRKLQEVKALLYLLKITIFRCSFCLQKSMTKFPDKKTPEIVVAIDERGDHDKLSNSGQNQNPKEEIGVECLQLNPEEDYKRTKVDCQLVTKDSGIGSTFSSMGSSTTSMGMKRSLSSKNFSFNFSNNNNEFSSSPAASYFEEKTENNNLTKDKNAENIQATSHHQYPYPYSNDKNSSNNISSCSSSSGDENIDNQISKSSVSFHLGEDADSEQSFSKLSLGDPDLDRLKSHSAASKITNLASISFMESVERNENIEKIEGEENKGPIEIELNIESNSTGTDNQNLRRKPICRFCPYCDSVGIVDKFSPFYYLQWIQIQNNKIELTTENYDVMRVTELPWVILNLNLDKNQIKTVNCPVTSTLPSSLVENLTKQVSILIAEGRESEIEDAVSVQLDFIRRLGEDFGYKLNSIFQRGALEEFNLTFILDSIRPATKLDLPILFNVAKLRYPKIEHRFFLS